MNRNLNALSSVANSFRHVLKLLIFYESSSCSKYTSISVRYSDMCREIHVCFKNTH